MPIVALSNPSTLQQLQAIGVLPQSQYVLGGGIASPLPQTPQAPPQAPAQPSPTAGFTMDPASGTMVPNAAPIMPQGAPDAAFKALASGPSPLTGQPQALPQPPTSAPPDLATGAQSLQAMQDADSQPAPRTGLYAPSRFNGAAQPQGPQTDPYSGATMAPASSVSEDTYSPLASQQTAPETPPGPATGSPGTDSSPLANETPQQRYNRLYQSVIGGESGGDDSAKNPNSTASGRGQITDGTYQSWLATPAGKASGFTMADKNTPAAQNAAGPGIMASNDQQFQTVTGRPATDSELKASWLLGGDGAAKLAAHPDEPITSYLSPDAIKNNSTILSPSMTGAQALQSAARYYNLAGGVQVAGPGAPTGGAQGRLANAQQASGGQSLDAQGNSIGINANEIASIAQQLGYKPTSSMIGPGDSLLATGMAMMGGRTYADSMKNGSAALLASRGQQLEAQGRDNSSALGIANAGVGIAQTNAEMRLKQAQLAQTGNYQANELGVRKDEMALSRDKLQQQIDQQNKMYEIALGKLGNQTTTTNATVSGDKAANGALGKEGGTEAGALLNSADTDAKALADIKSTRALIASQPGLMGPTAVSAVKRQLAMWGITDDAGNLNALEKGLAANRTEALQEATNGHVGSLRALGSMKMMSQAVPASETDPRAADYLMSIQQQATEQKIALRNAYMQHINDPAWQGKNFLTQKAQFEDNFYASTPPPQWVNGHGTASPIGAPKPGSVIHYDGQGNPIQ